MNSLIQIKQIYALHDQDPTAHGGAIRIPFSHAIEWNQRGYGIFHVVNEFSGRKLGANVTVVNAWFVEIDDGTKEEMVTRIKRGLVPSLVVEGKRGYHLYWKAKDGSATNFNAIVADRLIPFYQADPVSRDVLRLLRVPGFYHLKDPTNPVEVQVVWENPVSYSEVEMLSFYEAKRKKTSKKTIKTYQPKPQEDDGSWRVLEGFWERVWNLNCEEALTRLSGTKHVQFETYEFKETGSGNKNIYVNGKLTSCWIDVNGHIGSKQGGGPTIYSWLNWFHHDKEKVIEMIKKEFPECS